MADERHRTNEGDPNIVPVGKQGAETLRPADIFNAGEALGEVCQLAPRFPTRSPRFAAPPRGLASQGEGFSALRRVDLLAKNCNAEKSWWGPVIESVDTSSLPASGVGQTLASSKCLQSRARAPSGTDRPSGDPPAWRARGSERASTCAADLRCLLLQAFYDTRVT